MADHDFIWKDGEDALCRHCGDLFVDASPPCNGDGHGLYEKIQGMDATKTKDNDDGILCFSCSQDLIRGTEHWFDKELVLEAKDIEEGTLCVSCGSVWESREKFSRGEYITPGAWHVRGAVEMMGEAVNE